tara:strand:- start:113 stop:424 length:312 start_codon:yes stop_codon:yes gene_type:complete
MIERKIFGVAGEKVVKLCAAWNKMLPDHLSLELLMCCMFVHQGKDAEEKLRRFEDCRKELTKEQALWVMSLLMLEKVVDLASESDEAQTFYAQVKDADKETRH